MSEPKNQHWTHSEALKAAKVFRKHGVPCRVYKTKGWNGPNDSYLVVYVEKDGIEYDTDAAHKECNDLGIDARYRYLRQG